MNGMILDKKYNRADFASFLSGRFLPDDFEPSKTNIAMDKASCAIKDAVKLGVCPSLDLGVYEFRHGSSHDPRVTLSRESFNILRNNIESHALAVFFNEDTAQWRFSLIASDYTVGKKTGQVKREFSNPRRFSYLLGENCKLHTPESMLINKGIVKSVDDLVTRFAIEVVTKEFYKELFKWYDDWAVALVKFPSGRGKAASLPKEPDIEKNRQHLIRLITRLIFVWFLKQKDGLVPEWIFDKDEISKVLNNFDANNEKQGNYYNGIIQNLFFSTLNKPIHERLFANHEEAERNKDYMIKTAFRDFNEKSLFSNDYDPRKNPRKFVDLFNSIPFLNGGLFECLDNSDTGEYIDGFSREEKRVAFVPNCLFWGNGEREGLLTILKRYNFTIEENTPQDIDIALDPELLGKVFENLLSTYNKETQETARKESGSFYTPREVVDYMVDVSLREYLKGKLGTNDSLIDEKLEKLFCYHEDGHDFDEEVPILLDAINNCKILDPACGSGAFPMSILNRLVFIIQKLDPRNEIWRKLQIEKVSSGTAVAYNMEDTEKRDKRLNEIKEIFDIRTGKHSNYARKLFLIENCIYGVDIQAIAIQISKLRFFISLIVDQEAIDNIENNCGVLPLPNLETKFVVANTLVGIKQKQGILIDRSIEKKREILQIIRNSHFSAREAKEKRKLRKQDKELCGEIAKILESGGVFTSAEVGKILSWNPYDQTKSVDFFDSEWMFGLPKENDGIFDIVIGNPPYISAPTMVSTNPDGRKAIIDSGLFKTLYQKWDIYIPFMEFGLQVMNSNGVFSMIVPYPLTNQTYSRKLRQLIMEKYNLLEIVDLNGVKIFENATVSNCIPFVSKSESCGKCYISHLSEQKRITRSFEQAYSDLVQSKEKYLWNLNKEKIKTDLHSEMMLLGDFCYISKGMVINSDEKTAKGEFTKNDLISEKYDIIHCRKYIEAKDIEKYKVKKIRYLEYNTDRCPDKLSRPTFRELYEKPKLMFNRLGNLMVYYDAKTKFLHSDSMFSAVLWKDLKYVNNKSLNASIQRYSQKSSRMEMESYSEQVDLRYLLAILNSNYASVLLTRLRAGDYHIYPEHLRNIPIPLVKLNQQQPIIAIVDLILYLKSNDTLPVSPIIDNEAIASYFEKVIDACVYELYFEEEIKSLRLDVLEIITISIEKIKPLSIEKQVFHLFDEWSNYKDEIRNRMILQETRSESISQIIRLTR